MRKKLRDNGLKGWLYLLPAILFLGVFMVYPLIDVFVYSFEEGYNSASQSYFGVGAYNYSYVLHDPYFLQAVKKYFPAGSDYGSAFNRNCTADFCGVKFHKASQKPVPDNLFSALCDQYPGSGAGFYDSVLKRQPIRTADQSADHMVWRYGS